MKSIVWIAMVAMLVPWRVAHAAPAGADQPALRVSPTAVSPSSPITVTGTNFTPGTQYTITIGTTPPQTAQVTANADGNLAANFTIPAVAAGGLVPVAATSGGATVATTSFTISAPQITFAPGTIAAGTTVTASGSGLPPNTVLALALTVDITGGGKTPITVSLHTANDGAFSNVTFSVPSGTVPGSYPVQITQGNAVIGTGTLVVGQITLTLSPASLPTDSPGTFQAAGTTFLPLETIGISYTAKFSDGSTQTMSATATADASGNFSAVAVSVPADIVAGQYTVTAAGATSHRTAAAQLTVIVVPSLAVIPGAVPIGGTATIIGKNFAPSENVVLQAQVKQTGGTMQDLKVQGSTDANGRFSIAFPVPADASSGTVPVVATQAPGGGTATARALLTILPSQPALAISPSTIAAGKRVKMHGSGFLPGSPGTVSAQVSVNGTQQSLSQSIVPDSSGSFTATLDVPGGASGSAVVTASQPSINVTAQATLTIQSPPPVLPTATSTPAPVVGPTPPPRAVRLTFASLRTLHHVARAGSINRIDVQASVAERLTIWAHINFPAGMHLDYQEKTDSRGHWAKQFRIPAHATNRYSNRVYVHVQLWRGKETVKTFGSFLIKG